MLFASEEEYSEAERRRSFLVWEVHADYEIVDGLLRPVDDDAVTRYYYPLAAGSMVRDAARIVPGDRKSVITFARRWGLLGYDRLLLHVRTPAGAKMLPNFVGDSIAWVWAHAAGVRALIDLVGLLRTAGADEIQAYIESVQPPAGAAKRAFEINELLASAMTENLARAEELATGLFSEVGAYKYPSLVHGRRHEIAVTTWGRRGGPRRVAEGVVETIVNTHLAGVYPALRYERGGVELHNCFDALISVIYRHLAELVASHRVRACDYCQTPFIQTHGRQRFCPPEPWVAERGGESSCALRYRTDKRRKGGLS